MSTKTNTVTTKTVAKTSKSSKKITKDIQIIVDNREHELIKRLSTKGLLTFSIEALDLGDIVYKENDEILLVIERKSINDLKASMCDGRYREQKARLMSTLPRNRIMYIIEGNLDVPIDEAISNMPVNTLLGALVNTMLRDGIKVYKTASLNETSEFLVKLLDKLENDRKDYFNEEAISVTLSDYSSCLKQKKKSNMTPTLWLMNQLAMIPQVSEKHASEIIKIYPTSLSLIKAYENQPNEKTKEKMLADILYPIKNGKHRRIGDKVSCRIYQFFHGIEEKKKQEDDQEEIDTQESCE